MQLPPAGAEGSDAAGVVARTGSKPAHETHFWGLVVVVISLEQLAERLGDRLGEIRPAVQPGRQIAALTGGQGLGSALAFMTPEPR